MSGDCTESDNNESEGTNSESGNGQNSDNNESEDANSEVKTSASEGPNDYSESEFQKSSESGNGEDSDNIESEGANSGVKTSGSRYYDDFFELEECGKGGYGRVFRCLHKLDGKIYAVKEIPFNEDKRDEVLREVTALSSLYHTNVVRYHQAWIEKSPLHTGEEAASASDPEGEEDTKDATASDPEGEEDTKDANASYPEGEEDIKDAKGEADTKDANASYPEGEEDTKDAKVSELEGKEDAKYSRGGAADEGKESYLLIQMEYCSGALYKLFDQNIDSEVAWKYFEQIVEGIAYLHANQVIHRDLTSRNILLDDFNRIKISDFGLAKIFKDDEPLHTSADSLGNKMYRAPELEKKGCKFDCKVDIFSLGIILFEFLYFFTTGMERLDVLKMLKNDRQFPDSAVIKDQHKKFILSLISNDPNDRPSAEKILNDRAWLIGEQERKQQLGFSNMEENEA